MKVQLKDGRKKALEITPLIETCDLAAHSQLVDRVFIYFRLKGTKRFRIYCGTGIDKDGNKLLLSGNIINAYIYASDKAIERIKELDYDHGYTYEFETRVVDNDLVITHKHTGARICQVTRSKAKQILKSLQNTFNWDFDDVKKCTELREIKSFIQSSEYLTF